MANPDEKEMWVAWTHDAGSAYVMPNDIEDADDLVDEMVAVTATYADAMLDEYKERFGGGQSPRRKKKKKSGRRAEPEEEEEEEEEEPEE